MGLKTDIFDLPLLKAINYFFDERTIRFFLVIAIVMTFFFLGLFLMLLAFKRLRSLEQLTFEVKVAFNIFFIFSLYSGTSSMPISLTEFIIWKTWFSFFGFALILSGVSIVRIYSITKRSSTLILFVSPERRGRHDRRYKRKHRLLIRLLYLQSFLTLVAILPTYLLLSTNNSNRAASSFAPAHYRIKKYFLMTSPLFLFLYSFQIFSSSYLILTSSRRYNNVNNVHNANNENQNEIVNDNDNDNDNDDNNFYNDQQQLLVEEQVSLLQTKIKRVILFTKCCCFLLIIFQFSLSYFLMPSLCFFHLLLILQALMKGKSSIQSYKTLKLRNKLFSNCANVMKEVTKLKKETLQNEICPICRLNLSKNVKMLDCGHCFHTSCIRTWILYSPTCPTCRKHIIDTTQNHQQHQWWQNNTLLNFILNNFNRFEDFLHTLKRRMIVGYRIRLHRHRRNRRNMRRNRNLPEDEETRNYIQAQVNLVHQVLPHVPIHVIIRDLMSTLNANQTIQRLLERNEINEQIIQN
ncbi:e3 ubiquitin-protein ligase rnf8 [Anaeramoeba flamelloides]|uniref:E3 ubiquitin-protein ligase rnf8 n=1 Tax=Anaeramoeba flamelloides TaxID=1746091 RepID=A0ABQ8XI00_9EUKA|nr:e3 ubiquitin-protein ligase rnf8 [Anaeramoeba flamelloides]